MKQTYTYKHYYKYDEITTVLQNYASNHPNYCCLSNIGTSPAGRKIWLLKVTDTSTGEYDNKPALYIEGNIHAGEVTGCMAVMYFLDTIFTNIEDEKIKNMLKKYTIYAVPRLSVDGSEFYLNNPQIIRSTPVPYIYETTQDGLNKVDLDGDGSIRLMRVKSPYGDWKISSEDSRLMVKRNIDDLEGDFYHVFDEGLIQNYDGLNIFNAPSTCGNDFNRNYPFAWECDHSQPGAGDYPLSNVETKANADFLLAHNNICYVIDMHTSGGQNLYTPGWQTRSKTNSEDVELNKSLAQLAQKENGYPAINIRDEYFPQSSGRGIMGSFCDFVHFMVGAGNVSIECWDLNARAGVEESYPPKENTTPEEREANFAKVLKWVDENVSKEEGFKEWTEFNHPQLGLVEIGGYDTKFIRQNPPFEFLQQEVEKHTRFFHRVINTLPCISFDKVEVNSLGEDLYKVEVIVGNTGYMPTYVFKEGLKHKRFLPLSVELIGDVTLCDGKLKQEIGNLGGLFNTKSQMATTSFGSNITMPTRQSVSWIVKASKNTDITIKCSGARIGESTYKLSL